MLPMAPVYHQVKNLWARWMQGGPAASMYSVSESGWMEGGNFLQWFEKMFLSSVKSLIVKYPVVLFFDGHHLSVPEFDQAGM